MKDKHIVTHDPVSDDDIRHLKRHLEDLFPGLDLKKLQKATVSKHLAYQTWLQRHCRQRVYSFQIRKCDDPTCCRRMMPNCQWYGTDTTDCDRATAATKHTPQRKLQEKLQVLPFADQQESEGQ